jgi:hypothetical protein
MMWDRIEAAVLLAIAAGVTLLWLAIVPRVEVAIAVAIAVFSIVTGGY